MAEFTWTADFGASEASKPSVSQLRFGDGYEQRVAHGLNVNPKNWNLRFANRTDTEADEILDFLNARVTEDGAQEAFDWTPPLGATAYKFVCRSWQRTLDRANLNTITMTLEQVYEP